MEEGSFVGSGFFILDITANSSDRIDFAIDTKKIELVIVANTGLDHHKDTHIAATFCVKD